MISMKKKAKIAAKKAAEKARVQELRDRFGYTILKKKWGKALRPSFPDLTSPQRTAQVSDMSGCIGFYREREAARQAVRDAIMDRSN